VDSNKVKYGFDQVDYCLIRLLLIALFGVSGYKLVELEFRGLPDKISPGSSVTRLRCDGEATSVKIASASEPVMTGPKETERREKQRPKRQGQRSVLSSSATKH